MELKVPFKLNVKYLNHNKDHFEGKAIFHEKEHDIDIHAQVNSKKIKVPFEVIGVTDEEILVRLSGPSGVYIEDRVEFDGQSQQIQIESDAIFHEVFSNQAKIDTIEIFVR